MNEQEKQEVLKALQLIKDICNSNRCEHCPFYDAYSSACNITCKPCDWDNKKPEEKEDETWRAFN